MKLSEKVSIKKNVSARISSLYGFNKAFTAFNILKLEYKLHGFDLNDFHHASKENAYDGYYGLHNTVIDAILNLQ